MMNMDTISLFHYNDYESSDDYDDSINYRPNHLSFCNHRILTNKVLNFFYNDNLEEEWCKGFLTTWNNSSTKKFVYE